MIVNLLNSSSSASTGGFDWSTLLMFGLFGGVIVLMMVFQRRSQKRREEEANNLLNSIKPGNTVKTIGGICGTIVEICDDGTFVMETGTDKSGKSYLKFDKMAIAQTDAEVSKEEKVEKVEDKPVFEESVPSEQPTEENTEENKENE